MKAKHRIGPSSFKLNNFKAHGFLGNHRQPRRTCRIRVSSMVNGEDAADDILSISTPKNKAICFAIRGKP